MNNIKEESTRCEAAKQAMRTIEAASIGVSPGKMFSTGSEADLQLKIIPDVVDHDRYWLRFSAENALPRATGNLLIALFHEESGEWFTVRTDTYSSADCKLPSGQFGIRLVDDVRTPEDVDLLLRHNDLAARNHLDAVAECSDTPEELKAYIQTVASPREVVNNSKKWVINSAIKDAHTSFQEGIEVAVDQLNALVTRGIFDQFVVVPAPSGLGDTSTETSRIERHQVPAQITKDLVLKIRCTIEDLPFGFGAVYLADSENLFNCLFIVPDANSNGYSIDIDLPAEGIEAKPFWKARIVAADGQSASLFNIEDRASVLAQSTDPHQQKLINEFFDRLEKEGK